MRRSAQRARRPQTRTRLTGSILLIGFISLFPGLASMEPEPTVRAGQTAVAIVLEGDELPAIEAMQTWFVDEDGPRRVVAVEKGPAEVVVIRDPAAQPFLDLLANGLLVGQREEPSDEELAELRDDLRRRCPLGDGTRLSFVSPRAAPVSRTVEQMNVFNLSTSFEVQGFLSFVNAVPSMRFVLRVADAVWLFGRELPATGQRRAVVVMTVATSLDESQYSVESVRETLEKVQVPVFAWSFGTGPVMTAWGGRLTGESPDSINLERDLPLFEEACSELGETLESQRIVWLEGPPEDFSLSADASGIRLAGERPAPETAAKPRGRRGGSP